MKLMIASDIHGSAYYCKKMIDAYIEEEAERLLLLGDVLYHGPRNDLPKDYAPKTVIEMLNNMADKILCVRGNCDTEVDQMVLDFPILADYAVIAHDNTTIYATHGHVYGEENPPKGVRGGVLLCGHTHIPKCEDKGGYVYMNPGSVSIPKDGSGHSYMIFENGIFTWKTFDCGPSNGGGVLKPCVIRNYISATIR